MGLKIALFSGGKESFYASMLEWPVDLYLILIYDFPRQSPHLINLHAVIYSATLTGKPAYAIRLNKGREFLETVEVLRRLNADTIVAGDVFVEDHLKYMESLANECGAKLREPLWNMDTRELLIKEVDFGLEFIITGVSTKVPVKWLCKKVNKDNVYNLLSDSERYGFDPVGEYGEYHTQIIKSPVFNSELKCKCIKKYQFNDYIISLLELIK